MRNAYDSSGGVPSQIAGEYQGSIKSRRRKLHSSTGRSMQRRASSKPDGLADMSDSGGVVCCIVTGGHPQHNGIKVSAQ
eukprot:1421332-Amphidinium_carterae.1